MEPCVFGARRSQARHGGAEMLRTRRSKAEERQWHPNTIGLLSHPDEIGEVEARVMRALLSLIVYHEGAVTTAEVAVESACPDRCLDALWAPISHSSRFLSCVLLQTDNAIQHDLSSRTVHVLVHTEVASSHRLKSD